MGHEVDKMRQITRAAEERARSPPPPFETEYETEYGPLIETCAAEGRYEVVIFFDSHDDVAIAKTGFEEKGYTAKAKVLECDFRHDECCTRCLVVSWKP